MCVWEVWCKGEPGVVSHVWAHCPTEVACPPGTSHELVRRVRRMPKWSRMAGYGSPQRRVRPPSRASNGNRPGTVARPVAVRLRSQARCRGAVRVSVARRSGAMRLRWRRWSLCGQRCEALQIVAAQVTGLPNRPRPIPAGRKAAGAPATAASSAVAVVHAHGVSTPSVHVGSSWRFSKNL